MIYAIKKNAKKKLSDNFNSFEFDCKCDNPTCTFTLYSLEMLRLLEQLRLINENRPLVITSGFRCSTHNKSIFGKPNSQHLVGLACDISCPPYLTFDNFKKLIYKLPFKFIKCYSDEGFIHVDLRTGDY